MTLKRPITVAVLEQVGGNSWSSRGYVEESDFGVIRYSDTRWPSVFECRERRLFHHRINPLNPELNPICYLLALLGAYIFSTLAG